MEKRPLTLLTIDDSDATLDLIEGLVSENFPDAAIIKANSGKKGLRLAASEDPDVILLDILMPVMDGFEVCRQLKADNALREIPVVFVTVLIDTAQRIKALDAGAEGFLNKPVDEAELIAQIRAMVKIKSANRQKREEAEKLKKMVEERTAELNQKIEAYKKVQESLQASEEKFSDVFFSNPYMLAITRIADGKIIEVNDAFCQVAGCSREEAINSSTFEMKIWVNPQDRELLVSALLDGRKVDKWQFPFRKKNGDVITGLISSQLLNVSGEPCIVSYIEDVTEQKKTEEELNEMNARFFAFTENLPVTMFIKNTDQQVLYVNKEMKRVFGDQGWTGKTVYDIFPHQIAQKLIEADNRSFEKGYSVSTHVLPDKQGAERAWETHVFRIERTKRKPLIGGFSLDITDRIKMEHALLQSEENLRNFFNNSIDFLWVMSYKAEIIAVNNTVINRLGYSQKELVGQKVDMLHHPRYFEEGRIIKDDIIQGKRDDCPIPLQSKTGEQIPVETIFFRGVWNGEQCLFGISRDISQLKMSEEKFSKAFHTSPNIVGMSDIETGEYVEVNNAFCDKLEYAPEEVIGKKVMDVIRMDKEFRNRTIKKLIANGFVRNEETVIYSKSGKPLNVLLSADIIRVGNRDHNFTTAVDITAIRKAEAELKYYAQLLEIIMNIATRYINLPLGRMDEGLNDALRDIGRFVGAERAYVFTHDTYNANASCTNEWHNDGHETMIRQFQKVPLKLFPDHDFHSSGKTFFVTDVDQLSEGDVKDKLIALGIKSLISFPLLCQDECKGFIGFASDKINKCYTGREKMLFEIFAQVLVNMRVRMKDQNEILLTTARFRAIYENAPLFINAFNQDGRCVLWNRQCEKTFGWSFDEMTRIDDPLRRFYPDPAVYAAVRKSVIENPVNEFLEFEPMTKSGEKIITLWMNYRLPDGLIINLGYDITERRKAEMALLESEKGYRSLFESMNEGITYSRIICDKKGKPCDWHFISLNRAHEVQTGLKNTEIIGKRVTEIFPDIEPFWIELYGKVALTGEPARTENFNRNTGRYYEVSVYSPKTEYFISVVTDVTERRYAVEKIKSNLKEITRYRNKLKQLNASLIDAEENERRKIAEFLHDGLGQLLSITHIRLTSLLYENKLPGEVEKVIIESSKTVNDAIVQCREMTYELNPPILKNYGLVEAVKWKLEQVQKQFNKSVSLQSKAEIDINDDKLELLLYRIVCELINNVIKHAGCSRIKVETDMAGKKQVISVIDDGNGFNYNPEKQPSGTNSFGLFSIRERLEHFHGILSIKSSPGKGTKASIVF